MNIDTNENNKQPIVLIDGLCPKCINEIENSPDFHIMLRRIKNVGTRYVYELPKEKSTREKWLSIFSPECLEKVLKDIEKIPKHCCIRCGI